MAMEYLYMDQGAEHLEVLQNFRGLQWYYDGGDVLEILDEHGDQKAFFYVQPRTCYLLQRRNQSALRVHEVTPPRFCVDVLAWMFGFGRKQRCDDYNSFVQACNEYQATHPDLRFIENGIEQYGMCFRYAFALRDDCAYPVAYYYRLPGDTNWAFFGKELEYGIVANMHRALGKFKYPLQYMIHLFRCVTMSYPVETREFFRDTLGHRTEKVHYASDPEGGF